VGFNTGTPGGRRYGETVAAARPKVEENPASVVDILSVSPLEGDHDALERAFDCHVRARYPDYRWQVHRSAGIVSALATLQRKRIPVLICEHSLAPGIWVDVLEELALLPDAPSLIVSSRLADERLWAEVLHQGAFDLLAKPFDSKEVARVVSSAWIHWQYRCARFAPASLMRAAG